MNLVVPPMTRAMEKNLVPGAIARKQLRAPGPPMSHSQYGMLLEAANKKGARLVRVSELRQFDTTETYAAGILKKRVKLPRVDCPVCGINVSILQGHTHHHKNPAGEKCAGAKV